MDSRRGLEMWGPVGRWVFLNWPRGSWQYDLICGVIILGLFVLPNPPPQTQNLDLDDVLAAIEAASDAIESFTADMTATERIELFDDEETESGTVAFLKPAYIRREITDPGLRTELIADESVTVYIPRIKQARIMPLGGSLEEGRDLNVPGMISTSDLRTSFDVSLLGVSLDDGDGVRLYLLHLVPKPNTSAARRFKRIALSVAEGEWHPARQIVLEEHSGTRTTIVLTKVHRDAGLDPDDFRLELPDDVEIIRQAALRESLTENRLTSIGQLR